MYQANLFPGYNITIIYIHHFRNILDLTLSLQINTRVIKQFQASHYMHQACEWTTMSYDILLFPNGHMIDQIT